MTDVFADRQSFQFEPAPPEPTAVAARMIPARGRFPHGARGLVARLRAFNQARRELSHYTDEELAQLGIPRPRTLVVAMGIAFGRQPAR